MTKLAAVACALGLHIAVVAAILAHPSDVEPTRISPPIVVSMVELVSDTSPQSKDTVPEPRPSEPTAQAASAPSEAPPPEATPEQVAESEPVAEPEPPSLPDPLEPDIQPAPPPPIPVEHHVAPESKPEPRKPPVRREPVTRRVVGHKPVVQHKVAAEKAPVPEKTVEPPLLAGSRPAAAPVKPGPAAQSHWVTSVAYQGSPPRPRYPAAAQRRGQTGKVVIRVLISAQGDVVNAAIEKSSGHELLDEAALDAVRRARFKPYKENGVAYSARADIPIDFVL